MVKLQFIDKIKIGIIDFEAYIVEDNNKLRAFGIYFQNIQDPILFFQQNVPNKKVEIIVNENLVTKLQLLKSKDANIRKDHFKTFKTFVLETEQIAKENAFKDAKLEYITDIQLLKSIEDTYINN